MQNFKTFHSTFLTGRCRHGSWPPSALVRPSNFQNAPFAAVRNAWSTTRALLPSLGAIANRAACASLTDYQSFFCAPTSSNAQAGTFASPLPPKHLSRVCRSISATRALRNFIALLWARKLSWYISLHCFGHAN